MAEQWLNTREATKALGYKSSLSLLNKRVGKPHGFLVYGEHWRVCLDGGIHYQWNIEAVREAIRSKPDHQNEARRLAQHRKYLERLSRHSGIIPDDPTQWCETDSSGVDRLSLPS